jgi:hypothetical protein
MASYPCCSLCVSRGICCYGTNRRPSAACLKRPETRKRLTQRSVVQVHPPATNPFNHLPAFATRVWHHLTPELCVSRRHDLRGGRACKQCSESSRDLAAVLGDHVCISHRRARIGVTEAILSSRHRNTLAVHHGLVPVAKSVTLEENTRTSRAPRLTFYS